MNCRRVQRLMPLYAEEDLRPALASRIASHLEWCGSCNWLADEYKESQSWLRASSPPEFDSALLDSVRNGALAQIAASKQRVSPLAVLTQYWNRRQVLALCAAALIILGAFLAYVYQSRVKVTRPIEMLTKLPAEAPPVDRKPGPSGAAEAAPGASLATQAPVPKKVRHSVPRLTVASAPVENHQLDVTQAPSPEPASATGAISSSDSRDMLRIEIQTSDPLIRIIWFAPRESDSPPTKPATD
jgi:hypothetical protein